MKFFKADYYNYDDDDDEDEDEEEDDEEEGDLLQMRFAAQKLFFLKENFLIEKIF